MQKHLLLLFPCVAVFAIGMAAAPSFAMNGREFIEACDKAAGCNYRVSDSGAVTGGMNGKVIDCPPHGGKCTVIRQQNGGNPNISVGSLSSSNANVDGGGSGMPGSLGFINADKAPNAGSNTTHVGGTVIR